MATLADGRMLNDKLFPVVAMKLSYNIHGVKWAKKVFAMAGFRDTVFHKAIEEEEITLKKSLTYGEKQSIISLVLRIATAATVDSAVYKWYHSEYGEGATRNRGETVGKCFALFLKGDKALVMEGEAVMMVDPMDEKLFIIKQGDVSGHIKKAEIVGFWSNWMKNPLPPSTKATDIFEIK